MQLNSNDISSDSVVENIENLQDDRSMITGLKDGVYCDLAIFNRSNDDSDDIIMFNNQTIEKNTRKPYSHKEEISIVNYIIKNNNASKVTEITMWQNMERDRVCEYRIWQSMKQRYLKHIETDLNSGNNRFPFLSPEDLKLLQREFVSTC